MYYKQKKVFSFILAAMEVYANPWNNKVLAKLYKEFYNDIKTNMVCNMNPEVYGRSVLEHSSFIATSNNPDKRIHGQGFVNRLSGSTAEMLNIYLMLFTGGKIFDIKDIQLGRIPGMRDLSHNLLKNVISDEKIRSMFADAGLHIEPHLDEHYIYYSTTNIVNDLSSKMGSAGGQNALFVSMFKEMLSAHKFDFDFYSNKMILGALPLLEFHTNENYCSSEYTINLGVDDSINNFLIPLMNEGKFSDSTGKLIENDLKIAVRFLSMGINNIGSDEREIINNKYKNDFVRIFKTKGINSIEEYTEIREEIFGPTGTPINDLMSNKVKNEINNAGSTDLERLQYFIEGNKISVNVNEEELHDVIKTTNPVGFSYTFQRRLDDDSGYKLNYMVIDNFYFNILNNKMYVVFGINLNGYETSLILTSTAKTGSTGTELEFPISSDNVYYGTYKCSVDMYDAFISLVDDAFKGGGASWFKLKGKEAFVVDFATALSQCSELSKIESMARAMGYSKEVTVEAKNNADKISDVGYLNLTLGFKKD